MRRAGRRDQTESPIVHGLRQVGYQVCPMQRPVDLLVRDPRNGRLAILEVDGVTKYRTRDSKQWEFIRDWQVPLVKTLDEALKALGSRIL